MIDIHTHLLPLVDDGSVSVENSLQMLKTLYESGVKHVILTPHYRGKYVASKKNLMEKFSEFKNLAQDIPVELYLGQEIFTDKKALDELTRGELLTLNESKYVLLEFDFYNKCDIVESVYVAKIRGFIPIVAHPERYTYLTIDDLVEIKEIGGLVQINADSITKNANKLVKKRAKIMLKNNVVDFIASDSHDFRPIVIQEAKSIIEKKYGKQMAEKLFETNAIKIIKGQTLV